jgi:peptidoglycan/LPS O-acetylase OafA/YrhL
MKRYGQLDSLRGLAALSVLFYHYLIVLNTTTQNIKPDTFAQIINFANHSPLRIFWGGYEAVVMFFVLSGFVLSLKFYTPAKMKYIPFLISRFCRIYLPYYVAITIAIFLDISFSKHGIESLSSWFNSIWIFPITIGTVINHIFLIKYFGYGQINPVLWTLAMEMRISLIFPFLIALIKYSGWKTTLAVGLILSFTYYFLAYSNPKDFISIPIDYFYTFAFVNMFIAGALIAKNHTMIVKRLSSLSPILKACLFISGILLFSFRYWSTSFANPFIYQWFSDVCITLGAVILILAALWGNLSSILSQKIVHFLGNISYSVYLYHSIFLLALIYLFYPRLSIYLIWIPAAILTLIASYLSYKYVELPSIKLGRILINKMDGKRLF